MIVICPGCSGIDCEVVKREFKDEKIIISGAAHARATKVNHKLYWDTIQSVLNKSI